MKRTASALALLLATCSFGSAATLVMDFDEDVSAPGNDFSLFNYDADKRTGGSTLGFASTNGVGGSGAMAYQFTGTTADEKRILAYYAPMTFDATKETEFSASIMLNAGSIDVAGTKTKAHLRMGFLATLNLPAAPNQTKLQQMWDQNPAVNFDASIEWSGTAVTGAKIRAKESNGGGAKADGPEASFYSANLDLDTWFKFTLTATRTSPDTPFFADNSFTVVASVYDMGVTGTEEPILLGTSTLTNYIIMSNFVTDSDVSFGLMFEGEKNAPSNSYNYYADNLMFGSVPEPGAGLLLAAGLLSCGFRRRR